MEIVFLLILITTMMLALGGGFPVAFALPGSAILTIGLAALSGYIFTGDVASFFAHGDPLQWLNAGVTNFRGIYWEAERDTLIAIPLFIFMGIMLERSKIAEDLLITMAQLFGPIPGGLGISVVVVGALLAATTGIVGATVVAMGLISLPVMLRANYSHSLATGTISASGTLGQIIPPSIVLIILADQLSNATDQAATIRTADFKAGTGQLSLPSEFGLSSTSAGDMFLGAFLPGLVLVGLYILYILVLALIRPKMAPAAPFEGKIDRKFAFRVLVVLVPPLTLIFTVLGSIIMGIATVNQAGAIGAVGAMVMAGYRLKEGQKGAYVPATVATLSIVALAIVVSYFDINVKSIRSDRDVIGIVIATIASMTFLASLLWSGWRTYTIDSTLQGVMVETAKTTALVFIILLGAAMLTASFRAFGGEELVRDFLSGLPGGFITKFIVVMAVIFVLGFFLDFIEIAVVVVPIIAPILLADPEANITAVWLGVMIGVNMQTSFLTPPFGFALFYLRGVAPSIVRTISMYRGVVPFILLQLSGLVIVGMFPPLVNYLPNKIYLNSDTAPPPNNPRLQLCLEEYLFPAYDQQGEALMSAIGKVRALDVSYLPEARRKALEASLAGAESVLAKVARVRKADAELEAFLPQYRPLHTEVRDLRVQTGAIKRNLDSLERERRSARRTGASIGDIDAEISELRAEENHIKTQIPGDWQKVRSTYDRLASAAKSARRDYRRTVDESYEAFSELRKVIAETSKLAAMEAPVKGLVAALNGPAADIQEKIKDVAAEVGKIAGVSPIRAELSLVARALRGDTPSVQEMSEHLAKARELLAKELAWRRRAEAGLGAGLAAYDTSIRATIGARMQERLNPEQSEAVASCLSHHRDISLDF
jgi:tripartite ATP-independent transporter DctM subunit